MREIKGSLKTRDALVARRRTRRLSSVFEAFLQEVGALSELNHEKIREIVRGYFQECLNEQHELVSDLRFDATTDLDEEASSADDLARKHVELLKRGSIDAETRSAAAVLLQQRHIAPGSVPLGLIAELEQLVLRSRIENWRITAAKLRADFGAAISSDPAFQGIEVSDFSPVADDSAATLHSLGVISARYSELKSKGAWVKKTAMDNQRVLALALRAFGNERPITSIAKDEVREFRDMITKLPASYLKRKGQALLPLHQLLKSDDGPKLSPKTQKKYFEMFRSFLKWCVADGYLEAMPGEAITLVGASKADVQDARRPFSHDQLKRFFSSPLYAGCKSASRRAIPGEYVARDGKWWIPIIGLYSGLRLGEIVQLLVSDIKLTDGIHYIDVARGEGEEKQLKTASSVRRVPLHSRLIDLGFLDFVKTARSKNASGRVFYDIEPGKDGYFSHNYSKWFGRYALAVNVKTPKTAFHSFRHNFKDALVEAQVTDTVRMALMGHSDRSVHANYGSGKFPLSLLDTAVQKIDYGPEVIRF